jgi:thiamine-phosphate pyrophosphorylase
MAPRLPARPFLYPIVDLAGLGPRTVAEAVSALARGGARVLQLRAKDVEDGRLVALAKEGLAAARAAGALFVVNDRPDVARIVGADGVHVGQDDLEPADVRQLLGPDALIGISTHDPRQLAAAAAAPVDYVAVGPIFPTGSKAAADPVVGLDLLRQARAMTSRPVVAIGGITRGRAAEVAAAGADGLAVISDLLAAPDLETAAREFIRTLTEESSRYHPRP